MENFSIQVEDINADKSKLIVKGRITSDSANTLNKKLDEVYKDKKHVILNMQDVAFLSSGGIRVLLMTYKMANGRGCSFFIEKPSENVINVLGMVSLDVMLLK
ncbi:MAG: STAS domain-containing protein [Treponema sp.]|nr:STAS domain-containing protein [Treponema sp.]